MTEDNQTTSCVRRQTHWHYFKRDGKKRIPTKNGEWPIFTWQCYVCRAHGGASHESWWMVNKSSHRIRK